jgi:hypothetical protein
MHILEHSCPEGMVTPVNNELLGTSEDLVQASAQLDTEKKLIVVDKQFTMFTTTLPSA